MNKKKLIFVLDAHLPYARDADAAGTVDESCLFNAITFTYLPLLRSFAAMERDEVPFRIAIAFSPELSEMLADSLMQERYAAHLESSISYAKKLLADGGLSALKQKTLEGHLALLLENMADFTGSCKKNILKGFDYFAKKGFVELLAAPATSCFFPFYQDNPEAINAQIETGLMSYRMRFSAIPDGFLLPALGWFPGLEKTLKAYGMRYSLVENTALLFSESPPRAGVFAPAECENGFIVFPRDSFASAEVARDEGAFCFNPAYLDTDRDIGFSLAGEELKPLFDLKLGRRVTGFRFFSRSASSKAAAPGQNSSDESSGLYDPDIAARQVEADAKAFLAKSAETLSRVSSLLEGAPVCRTCVFPASFFGGEWLEGAAWLEKVFRLASSTEEVSFTLPSLILKKRMAERERKREIVYPVFSSCLESGYADELLNSSNDWTYQLVKTASARMRDIAGRFPHNSGISERILNAAAREVLLAQSLNWPLLMNDPVTFEYARARFEESISAFTSVYESLGSNEVSTEWLTEIERKHTLFSFINYRAFCRRK